MINRSITFLFIFLSCALSAVAQDVAVKTDIPRDQLEQWRKWEKNASAKTRDLKPKGDKRPSREYGLVNAVSSDINAVRCKVENPGLYSALVPHKLREDLLAKIEQVINFYPAPTRKVETDPRKVEAQFWIKLKAGMVELMALWPGCEATA